MSLVCGYLGCMKCFRLIVILGDNVIFLLVFCLFCSVIFCYDQLKVNINLDKLMKSVRMKCCSLDCDWIGFMEYVKQYEINCLKVLVKCLYSGCDFVVVCVEINEYCKNCEQKQIMCFGCYKDIRKGGLVQY